MPESVLWSTVQPVTVEAVVPMIFMPLAKPVGVGWPEPVTCRPDSVMWSELVTYTPSLEVPLTVSPETVT